MISQRPSAPRTDRKLPEQELMLARRVGQMSPAGDCQPGLQGRVGRRLVVRGPETPLEGDGEDWMEMERDLLNMSLMLSR